MAKKIKDYYDKDCATLIAEKIQSAYPAFPVLSFVQYIDKHIVDKEFHARQDVFVDAFEQYLTGDYGKDIQLFTQILGPKLITDTGMFTYGYWLWPIGRYVQKHATKDIELSFNFIHELTQRFTGEFAIRTLLIHYPKETLNMCKKWSLDESVHVRRLASEGIRVSLPWGVKCLSALSYFDDTKEILTNLKNAPEKFVQKSVGNNINDIMKIAPDKANELINEWQIDKPSKETLWIIKHGLRSIIKKIS
jgi:3-methyladenine DNA glycosylase AlkC